MLCLLRKEKDGFYFGLVNPNEPAQVETEVKRLQERKNIWTGADQRFLYARGGTYKRGEQWLIPTPYSALGNPQL